MKKIIPILLIAVMLLSGCGAINPVETSEPTPSDEQLATRVADILTSMPPAPTQPPTSTVAPSEAPPAPAEATQEEPTATSEPTATATLEPQALPTTGLDVELPPTGTIEVTEEPGMGGEAEEEATSTPPPTSTPPASDPRLGLGKPTFSDKMDNGNYWASGIDRKGFTTVDFEDGQMVLTGLKTRSGWRLSRYATEVQSFYIEMTVTTEDCTGDDRYGIIFHVPYAARPEQGYWYGFTCDGRFAMQKWDGLDGPDGKVTNLLYWKASDAINAGSNATNRMGLMVSGNRFTMYANGIKLGTASDSTWIAGAYGVFVGARETKNFTILVDKFDFWLFPDVNIRPKPYRPTYTATPED